MQQILNGKQAYWRVELQDIRGNRADVRIGRVCRKIDLELRFRLAELQRLPGCEQVR